MYLGSNKENPWLGLEDDDDDMFLMSVRCFIGIVSPHPLHAAVH
jgi:hypothetical protein